MPGLVPREFYINVPLNLIPGAVRDSKVGSNDNIPSSTFILLSNVTSAAFPINFPASPIQMQVVSSSASDTGAGIGAQQVTIRYLRSPTSIFGFTENTEIVTLNGVTPVNTVNTDIYRINEFIVSRVGTGLFSAGNISLQSVGGATTFERIDAGTNRHRTAIHFVPNKFQCLLVSSIIGCSTAGGTIFILEETREDLSGNVVTSGSVQTELSNNTVFNGFPSPFVIQNPNNKEKFFAIVVKGRASNQTASATFSYIELPM